MTSSSDALAQLIAQHGIWPAFLTVFVGGLALNLTPCVYPMIPVTLAFFSKQASGSLGRIAALGASYVVGISLSYAALGLLAAQTGALLGSWLQQGWVVLLVAGLMVALALSMFGLYELRPPQALLQRIGRTSSGYWGACLMGMLIGIVAAPCIGPFVLGLLLVVGQLRDPAAGFFLFFVLGLGMGAPYMVFGIAAHRFGSLPRGGAWLIWCKQALGCVLLAVAVYFARPVLGPRLTLWAFIALLLGAGAYLGWLAQVSAVSARFRWLRRAVGASLLAAAAVIGWPRPVAAPGVPWAPFTEAALTEAQGAGRPVVIDVFADWCLPCLELDHTTFRNPTVVQAMTQVAPMKLDVTREPTGEQQRFLKRGRILGVPTVLFIDPQGEERRDLRLMGYEPPGEFLERLRRLLDGAP